MRGRRPRPLDEGSQNDRNYAIITAWIIDIYIIWGYFINYFKKLGNKLSKKAKSTKLGSIQPSFPEPLIVPRSEHTISRSDISEYALKVLYRLDKNGFQAYLVGGGIRDLLLGHHPKDFDIVTDATPEEVRSIFSNCRLIGRRFRLAHVFFGHHIIEVATFRGPVPQEGSASGGMILRDNVYGTLEEDAWRRDFTVNALYYNIADFSLVDYTGGLKDLEDRVLRIIGDPAQRLREDPVRILRAIRFAAKLELDLLPDLKSAMMEALPLLAQVSSARLFEEVLKLFHGGAAERVHTQLQEMGLFEQFFMQTHHPLEKNLIQQLMMNTDKRVKDGKSVAPDFLIATLLWFTVCKKIATYLAAGENEFSARFKAMNVVLSDQSKKLNLPKRLVLMIKEIWAMQFKLEKFQGKRAERLLGDYRFRSGYDLLVLRSQIGEEQSTLALATWWTTYTESSAQQRKALLSEFLGKDAKGLKDSEEPKKAKKPKKPKKPKIEIIETPEPESEFKLEADSPFTADFHFD